MNTYTDEQMADLARRLCEEAIGQHERVKALDARIAKLERFIRELRPEGSGATAWNNDTLRRMIDEVVK